MAGDIDDFLRCLHRAGQVKFQAVRAGRGFFAFITGRVEPCPWAVPSLFMKSPVSWTPERIAGLGRKSDAAIARSMAVSETTVRKKRLALGIPRMWEAVWTPEAIARLGKESDIGLARSRAVHLSTVRRKRRRLRIPKARARSSRWSPALIERLGREPDQSIADSLGISVGWVSLMRRKIGTTGRDS